MNIASRTLSTLVAALLILTASAAARASLIIAIDDAQFSPGGGGVVDVWISSDGSDTLNRFNFQFAIAPVGSTATQLRFLNPQNDSQLTDSRYVFAGGSLKHSGIPPFIPPSAVGSVSTTVTTNDTFIGADISTAGNVTLGSTPKLLAELDLVPGPGTLAPGAGDLFTIDLVSGVNTVFKNSSTTLVYTSTPGTISFASSAPEPASLVLFGTGVLGLALGGLRDRTRRRNRSNRPPAVG